MKLENTPEWRKGRNGEILMHAFAIEHGCTTFDISGTAHGRAPVLNSRCRNTIAPDALHIRNYPIWAEYKTKLNTFNWNGGNREIRESGGMVPCLAHGIDDHQFIHYQQANEHIPVVLWFLTLNTGMLHVASLDELGEPISSVRPELHPLVNWPLDRMRRVATFDRKRLFSYIQRPARQTLPTDSQRKELLHWLRPVQLEFEGFIEHFLTVCENRWHAAAS